MATDKKRLTISLDDDLLEKVLQYQDDKKLKTQSSAIVQLLELGMTALGVTPVVKNDSRIEKMYAELDKYGKNAVDAILDIEHSRCTEETVPEPKKIIPLFPAAAGPGEPQEGNAFDNIEATDERADFAVRISGDSMLPYFKDGDIVMCRRSVDAKTGDIAVIMVNGFLLVKQFFEGYNGQWYLRSLNRERSNLDYDYIPSSTDTPAPYGVVIHKRIPLVEQ